MKAAVFSLVLAACVFASGGVLGAGYVVQPGRDCDGYPRAPIETVRGVCAGIVYAPEVGADRPSQRKLHMPRALMFLPDGDLLITDLGAWTPGRGAVWRMTVHAGARPSLKLLLTGLNLPHTIAAGPDGGIYVGEMGRIIRFDPSAADPQASIEVVVSDLPANELHYDRHPLTSFIFDGDGDLLVNVGAASDQCPPVETQAGGAICPEAEGERPRAAIWRFAYLGQGRWARTSTVFARGLRNSVALARHPSGTLLQAENGVDLDDPDTPYDAIDVLRAGANYGWPYCFEAAAPAPAWKDVGKRDCAGAWRTPPSLYLPPHGAPLAMLYYKGDLIPELRGRLLVTLHGYRATGSRIVAYAVDERGAPQRTVNARYAVYPNHPGAVAARRYRPGPAADSLILTRGWNAVAGLRPAGAPVGMAVARDGALWVAEDRNGVLLRFAPDH
jgi:glucose/arabinose dehydrogenase